MTQIIFTEYHAAKKKSTHTSCELHGGVEITGQNLFRFGVRLPRFFFLAITPPITLSKNESVINKPQVDFFRFIEYTALVFKDTRAGFCKRKIGVQTTTKNTESVVINLDGRKYLYFMTNDYKVVLKRLTDMGYRIPKPQNWRWNPDLHKEVRDKMTELGTRYSLTMSNGVSVLNSYSPNSIPFIIFLSELCVKKSRKNSSFKNPVLPSNMPALLWACSQNSVGLVRFCIELGADLNARMPDSGVTPLIYAASHDYKNIVQILLDNGADISLRTYSGHSALFFAVIMGAKNTARVLEDAGATLENLSITPKADLRKAPFIEKFSFYLQNSFKQDKSKKYSRIYKQCGMSRQLFSKILCERSSEYRPKKKTVLQLAIGMYLTIEQTQDLLESAGYVLVPNDPFDAIIIEFISKMDHNIRKIEDALFKKTGKTLISYE